MSKSFQVPTKLARHSIVTGTPSVGSTAKSDSTLRHTIGGEESTYAGPMPSICSARSRSCNFK